MTVGSGDLRQRDAGTAERSAGSRRRLAFGAESNPRTTNDVIEKNRRLLAVAQRHGVDVLSAALQFLAAAPEAVALVVGAGTEQEIHED